jgi:hypothetical protein
MLQRRGWAVLVHRCRGTRPPERSAHTRIISPPPRGESRNLPRSLRWALRRSAAAVGLCRSSMFVPAFMFAPGESALPCPAAPPPLARAQRPRTAITSIGGNLTSLTHEAHYSINCVTEGIWTIRMRSPGAIWTTSYSLDCPKIVFSLSREPIEGRRKQQEGPLEGKVYAHVIARSLRIGTTVG